MEPDPTDPFGPPPGSGNPDEKDPMAGVVGPGWWALIDGVWHWMTDPVPKTVT
jgi:hypothetical protein